MHTTKRALLVCAALYAVMSVCVLSMMCYKNCRVYVAPDVMNHVTLFSLVSSNSSFYYMQTLLLFRSIKQFVAGKMLHLIVTDDVDPAIVHKLNAIAITHVISPYPNEPTRPHPNDTHILKLHDTWIHQLSKIKLWSLNVSEIICYLDSDLVFFGHNALQGVVSECVDGFRRSGNIEWCGFDGEDPSGNDSHWEMKTIQANFFCLKPNAALYAQMERELVQPFTHGQMVYKGKYVATEQDILNLFFNGRIHFVEKQRGDGGRFHHSNWNVLRWAAWDLGLKGFTGC